MRPINLDHQSSTPVLPEVFEAMRPYFTEAHGSPASLHHQGLRARKAISHAREQLAGLIHAESPDDLIFTSGGTEAINLAVKGAALANQHRGRHLVASAIEHPAVKGSLEFLTRFGFTISLVQVDSEGFVDPAEVAAAVTDQTILICVQHVNHDIGTIQPIREIADFAVQRLIPLFVDATASAGWLPIDVQRLGADLLAVAPHRFYGPKGVGTLYKNRRCRVQSLMQGGLQEGGRRAGTENVPAIVGGGAAAALAVRNIPHRMTRTATLQLKLLEGLIQRIPCLKLNGPPAGNRRMPTNLNLSLEFVEGEGVALAADVQGIIMASGASCVSRSSRVSPVLEAIGLNPALARGNIVLSLGMDNTEEEVAVVIEKLPGIVAKLRSMSPLWDDYQQGVIRSELSADSPMV